MSTGDSNRMNATHICMCQMADKCNDTAPQKHQMMINIWNATQTKITQQQQKCPFNTNDKRNTETAEKKCVLKNWIAVIRFGETPHFLSVCVSVCRSTFSFITINKRNKRTFASLRLDMSYAKCLCIWPMDLHLSLTLAHFIRSRCSIMILNRIKNENRRN